jgi:hypothetical protein
VGGFFYWFLRQTYKVFEDLIGLIGANRLKINRFKQSGCQQSAALLRRYTGNRRLAGCGLRRSNFC